MTEKLGKNNYLLWKVQVLPAVRGAQMFGYLDGTNVAPAKEIDAKDGDKVVKVQNPAYVQWVASDQQVLGYLMSSLLPRRPDTGGVSHHGGAALDGP